MAKRIERVNELIKKELGGIIFKEIELLEDTLVTITRVITSSNLSEALIFVSVLPEDKTREVLAVLNKSIYFLQQRLNQKLKMRPIPKIKFIEGRETKEAAKIEGILEELKKEEK